VYQVHTYLVEFAQNLPAFFAIEALGLNKSAGRGRGRGWGRGRKQGRERGSSLRWDYLNYDILKSQNHSKFAI
jgi:hypothetical protein